METSQSNSLSLQLCSFCFNFKSLLPLQTVILKKKPEKEKYPLPWGEMEIGVGRAIEYSISTSSNQPKQSVGWNQRESSHDTRKELMYKAVTQWTQHQASRREGVLQNNTSLFFPSWPGLNWRRQVWSLFQISLNRWKSLNGKDSGSGLSCGSYPSLWDYTQQPRNKKRGSASLLSCFLFSVPGEVLLKLRGRRAYLLL